MNKIISAKKFAAGGTRENRVTEIIVPSSAGSVVCRSKATAFAAGDVIAVAPLAPYKLTSPRQDDYHILIERALFSVDGVLVFHDVTGAGIKNAACAAAAFIGSQNNKKELVLSALGDLLAGYFALATEKSDYSPVVSKIIAEIDRELTQSSFSLDGFLKRLPLNYDYVRKLFKKEVSLTPQQYLLKKRMELAAGIILGNISNRYSDYTVSQTAEACGFSDPLYFSRTFKKYFGVNPSDYGKN